MGRPGRTARRWRAAAIGAASLAALALSPDARAQDASAPIGWIGFCRANPADCQPARDATRGPLRLTSSVFALLARINSEVNAAIEPESDQDQYGVEEHWTYPVSGRGDCEDYVLEKRRRLIARGLPASALLITVVRDRAGAGHAVLTVVTDRGDYVLDNETDEIRLAAATGYAFVKRQSPAHPNRWVAIGPDPGLERLAQR